MAFQETVYFLRDKCYRALTGVNFENHTGWRIQLTEINPLTLVATGAILYMPTLDEDPAKNREELHKLLIGPTFSREVKEFQS